MELFLCNPGWDILFYFFPLLLFSFVHIMIYDSEKHGLEKWVNFFGIWFQMIHVCMFVCRWTAHCSCVWYCLFYFFITLNIIWKVLFLLCTKTKENASDIMLIQLYWKKTLFSECFFHKLTICCKSSVMHFLNTERHLQCRAFYEIQPSHCVQARLFMYLCHCNVIYSVCLASIWGDSSTSVMLTSVWHTWLTNILFWRNRQAWLSVLVQLLAFLDSLTCIISSLHAFSHTKQFTRQTIQQENHSCGTHNSSVDLSPLICACASC